MKNIILSLSSILCGLGFIGIGNGLLNIVVPTKATQLEFSIFSIGLLAAFYYLGFLLGCFVTPKLVKKVGHIRCFAFLTASLCISALSFSYSSSAVFWQVLRILSGFSVAGLYMIAESWLNESVENQNRGKVISIYRVIDLGALVVGQAIMGRFSIEQSTSFLVAATLINIGLIPVVLTSSREPRPIENVRINFKSTFNTSRIGFLTCGLVGVANASFYGLAPQFAMSMEFSVQMIGIFLAAAVVSGALFQLFVGRLSDKTDREQLLFTVSIAAAIAGLCIFGVGSTSKNQYVLMTLSLLWGAFAMPLYSLAIAIANDRAMPENFLELSGALLMIYSAGAIFGPMSASLVIGIFGDSGLFLFISGAHFVMAGFVFYRRQFKLHAIPKDERSQFVSSLRTTPVIFESDPRSPKHLKTDVDCEAILREEGSGDLNDLTKKF